MQHGSSMRSPVTRARRVGEAPFTCSCELVIDLMRDPSISLVLSQAGLSLDGLLAASQELHRRTGPEPADWFHRLSQRGARAGSKPGLEHILALLRSPDCHGYRTLESAGADISVLRKRIFEALRSEIVAPLHATSRPAARRQSAMERAEAQAASSRDISAAPVRGRTSDWQEEQLPVGSGELLGALEADPVIEPLSEEEPTEQAEPVMTPASRNKKAQESAERLDPKALQPMQGRQDELALLADALLRKSPRAPLLVGEQGSGRTLLARHLAAIVQQPVFYLRASDFAESTELRAALHRVHQQGGIAIVDDLDRVATDQPPDILPALMLAWASAKPRCLTIVNHETRARLDAWMPGVLESLDVLVLAPLEHNLVHAAVKDAAPEVLARQGIELAPGCNLAEVTRLADRYLGGMAMPGRALDLLDLAAARARRLNRARIDSNSLVDIVCQRTNIPRRQVEGNGDQELLDLERRLSAQVVGHRRVIEDICRLIRVNRGGFRSNRPMLSALLLGPSGVGKTELAKSLAASLLSTPEALLRLDMSEYSEAHAVARIVGAPPGYVGYEQGGVLTDALTKQPHRIVLLDEIEKAHRDVHQLLLQVFDEGRLTDGKGRTVDFRHTAIIMTSNLGADRLYDANPDESQQRTEDDVLLAARQAFPVELWNRIEAPLVMHPLDEADMRKICLRLAQRSAEQLAHDRGVRYTLDPTACDYLVGKAGEDRALGARPLRHLLSREVESLLADAILRGQLRAGSQVTVSLGRQGLEIR